MPEALIDTDILSEIFSGKDQQVMKNAAAYVAEHNILTFSSVTLYEIVTGLEQNQAQAKFALDQGRNPSAHRKGALLSPRQTSLGKSRPSEARTSELSTKHKLYPTGIAAANLLGFTTQNAARPQYATSGTNTPTQLRGSKVYTRRPAERDNLSIEDGALLEFLRARGNTSELSAEQTARKLVKELQDRKRFQRIATAAQFEPPRVRAMLGAIAEETKQLKKP